MVTKFMANIQYNGDDEKGLVRASKKCFLNNLVPKSVKRVKLQCPGPRALCLTDIGRLPRKTFL